MAKLGTIIIIIIKFYFSSIKLFPIKSIDIIINATFKLIK